MRNMLPILLMLTLLVASGCAGWATKAQANKTKTNETFARMAAYDAGWNDGYHACLNDTNSTAYSIGWNAGYHAGLNETNASAAYRIGWNDGYLVGLNETNASAIALARPKTNRTGMNMSGNAST